MTALAAPSKNAGADLPMINIPGGDFQMGDKDDPHARPVHKVTVAAFQMDKDPVTVAAYQACLDAGACTTTTIAHRPTNKTCNLGVAGRDRNPINCVSWSQAKAFCEWAGKRLPTEEEYELAVRGTDGRTYPWGNDDPTADNKRACYARRDSDGTCNVGSFPAGNSPLGLEDLAGNVEIWTSTVWTGDYEVRDHARDLTGGQAYVGRGGGWRRGTPGAVSGTTRWMEVVGPTSSSELGMRCAK